MGLLLRRHDEQPALPREGARGHHKGGRDGDALRAPHQERQRGRRVRSPFPLLGSVQDWGSGGNPPLSWQSYTLHLSNGMLHSAHGVLLLC